MLAISHKPEPQFTRKRSRSLDDHADYPLEILGHKRAKRDIENFQQEATSVLQPGKTFEYLTQKQPTKPEGKRNKPASVTNWLEILPASSQEFEDMSQSSSKRPRAPSESSDFQPDNESDSSVSRSKKYSIYEDPRYETLLENKHSFMRDSQEGPLPEERAFYKSLFTRTAPIPKDPAFEEQLILLFLTLLQNRSELHVCILLHSRLVPPAEYLSLIEPQKFDSLIEGYNECWNKAIVFYKKLPQPDHTVAYRDSVLTDQQRRKLSILPEVSSFYAGREGTCFPFFTCEVKCGKQALDIADRANINSMTIALQGIVRLYRRAECVTDIHRRILGFSISHDDKSVRIYGHYPEIDGENTSYYRHPIRVFALADENGKDRWTSYTFTYNLYTQFAPKHIERIKKVIDRLPDPLAQSLDSDTILDDSQGVLSAASTSQMEFIKPGLPQGRVTNAQLRQQMQILFEQQRKDSEKQRKELMAQLEQQRKDSEKERKELMAQLEQQRKDSELKFEQQRKDSEQQRKDSEQQRKDSEKERKELMAQLEQQRKELMQLLKQQTKQ